MSTPLLSVGRVVVMMIIGVTIVLVVLVIVGFVIVISCGVVLLLVLVLLRSNVLLIFMGFLAGSFLLVVVVLILSLSSNSVSQLILSLLKIALKALVGIYEVLVGLREAFDLSLQVRVVFLALLELFGKLLNAAGQGVDLVLVGLASSRRRDKRGGLDCLGGENCLLGAGGGFGVRAELHTLGL